MQKTKTFRLPYYKEVFFIIYHAHKSESNVRRNARGRTTQANEDIAEIERC